MGSGDPSTGFNPVTVRVYQEKAVPNEDGAVSS